MGRTRSPGPVLAVVATRLVVFLLFSRGVTRAALSMDPTSRPATRIIGKARQAT